MVSTVRLLYYMSICSKSGAGQKQREKLKRILILQNLDNQLRSTKGCGTGPSKERHFGAAIRRAFPWYLFGSSSIPVFTSYLFTQLLYAYIYDMQLIHIIGILKLLAPPVQIPTSYRQQTKHIKSKNLIVCIYCEYENISYLTTVEHRKGNKKISLTSNPNFLGNKFSSFVRVVRQFFCNVAKVITCFLLIPSFLFSMQQRKCDSPLSHSSNSTTTMLKIFNSLQQKIQSL